jgi:hypothetical protein
LLEFDEMIIGVPAGRPCSASMASGTASTCRYARSPWLPPSGILVVNCVPVGLFASCARAFVPGSMKEAALVMVNSSLFLTSATFAKSKERASPAPVLVAPQIRERLTTPPSTLDTPCTADGTL